MIVFKKIQLNNKELKQSVKSRTQCLCYLEPLHMYLSHTQRVESWKNQEVHLSI